jgi:hypothetical protein
VLALARAKINIRPLLNSRQTPVVPEAKGRNRTRTLAVLLARVTDLAILRPNITFLRSVIPPLTHDSHEPGNLEYPRNKAPARIGREVARGPGASCCVEPRSGNEKAALRPGQDLRRQSRDARRSGADEDYLMSQMTSLWDPARMRVARRRR